MKVENGAEGGTRTRMDFSTRPSNVRVYQFHHFGTEEYYYNDAHVFKPVPRRSLRPRMSEKAVLTHIYLMVDSGCQTTDVFLSYSLFLLLIFFDFLLQTMFSTGAGKLDRESCLSQERSRRCNPDSACRNKSLCR